MKRAAGILLMIFLLISGRLEGQITGASITSSNYNVGTTLTATPAGSVGSGNTLEYEWSYVSPATVLGTTSTYLIVTADTAKSIQVKITEKDGSSAVIGTFTSSSIVVNSSPHAKDVAFTGTLKSGLTLTGSYRYKDVNSDPESGTTFKWYKASDAAGTGAAAISSANGSTYVLKVPDVGSYIKFGVTPAASAGSSPGEETLSATWQGPVLANSAPTVTIQSITGTLTIGSTLTGNFTYSDAEGDLAGTHIYRWLSSTALAGTYDTIPGATSTTYVILAADAGKYFKFYVKPYALTGTTNGTGVANTTGYGAVNSYPVAQYVGVSGTTKVGMTLTGSYTYSDVDGDAQSGSTFKWYRANDMGGTGKTAIASATSLTYVLTTADVGKYIGFGVVPRSSAGSTPGTEVISSFYPGPVTANSAPVATIQAITGTKNVNDVLTGHYTYSDAEGDVEGSSVYRWLSSSSLAGTYDTIAGATTISHQILMTEQGKYFKFYVKPYASTGTTNGTGVITATGYGPANSKPVASSAHVNGTIAISSILTAKYKYTDVDGNAEGTSTFRWFRDGAVISGATSNTYTITTDDEASKLRFEVTPVSASGYPNIGDPLLSVDTIAVPSSGTLPTATDLCIEGINTTGNTIKGKYKFTYSPTEDHSIYRWMRDTDTIPSATSITYTLTTADAGHDIYFVVIPYSKPPAHKRGVAVKSAALARILLAAASYSIADPSVTLAANVPGGIFSGTGVSAGVFTPAAAGTAGSPFTIKYNLSVTNTTNTCSQEASDHIAVVPIASYFSSFRNFYCHNGGIDTIYVENVPATASALTFDITKPSAVVGYLNPKAIIIDPSRMRPGNKVDTLFFSYTDGGSTFPIYKPFVIDSVGTNVTLANLDTIYCESSAKRYVTAEHTYPGGGAGIWTGTIMTDQTSTAAFIDPTKGTAGTKYTVTYQYVSPYGCRSNIYSQPVRIIKLPDSEFTLNPSYNIDGGPRSLNPHVAGGTFVGSGVVGTVFYPAIAGIGSPEIKYYVTDTKGCSSNTPHSTIVRKAQGTINNLAANICYKDTTINVTVSGLPTGVSIINFYNYKKSLVYTAGNLNADYSVKNAKSGVDTLRFTYTWDTVKYSLVKPVYIDSIGKIAISGLRDNYCEYDGLVSLRVFVENSTGTGNFAFSGPPAGFTNYGNLADFDPSKVTPSTSPYRISYTHVSSVNGSGCRKTVYNDVYVNKRPTVAILSLNKSVNYYNPPVILKGSPSKGIFSGKGVIKVDSIYQFNPKYSGYVEGSSSAIKVGINFSYLDTKGCYSDVIDSVTVSEAQGLITGIDLDNQYCYDGKPDTLIYSSGSIWSAGDTSLGFHGKGITKLKPGKAVFNPSVAGDGNHTITFKYKDKDSTIFTLTQILKVHKVEDISIDEIKGGEIFCASDNPFILHGSGSSADGTNSFSGPVISTMFTPSNKAAGDTAVTYIYKHNSSGCFKKIRVPVVINPAPAIKFYPADNCIKSNTDKTVFINNTTIQDPAINKIYKWNWSFVDKGVSVPDTNKSPQYHFLASGTHLVTLIATTVKNCSATKDTIIDMGRKPVADFRWTNECYHTPKDSLNFFDKTIAESAIVSRIWNFNNGSKIDTRIKPKYFKNAPGDVDVTYIVNTSYSGCSDTISRKVHIKPTKPISSILPYDENFDSGDGGWVKDYSSTNQWTMGTPNENVIKSSYSGTNSWFTHVYNKTKQDTAFVSVISPCFDFTNIERPMIKMMLWKRFDRDRNGASVQYQIDSLKWQYAGTIDDDGINWFNSALIGKPSGNLVGWTSKSSTPETGWSEARHKLDFLEGKKDVKFRIVYSSDGSSKDNDGMAFDNVSISGRQRNVLFEQFTNTSTVANKNANDVANEIVTSTPRDVINIRYHTNFPGADPYNAENPADVSSRVLYYGLTKTPYAFVDGGFNLADRYAGLYDFSLATPDTNALNRRSLIDPMFKMSISAEIHDLVLTVRDTIKALGKVDAENMTLYIAVAELQNSDYTGSSGESIHYNVLKKLLPDGGGIDLKKNWLKDDSYVAPVQTWVIQKLKKDSKIKVVAFLQNNITKEVYQAVATDSLKLTTGINDTYPASRASSFALYPNPAVNKFTIEFSEPLERDSRIRIYDFQGMLAADYKADQGTTEYMVEGAGLKPGLYLVKLIEGGVERGSKKLLITGK